MQESNTNTQRKKDLFPHRANNGVSPTTKVRDDRIDAVKYWLIVLVITGHVFQRPEFHNSTVCIVLWKWIYMFHMPLFIFISGYFSRKKDLYSFWQSIWKILEPLIIFHAIILLPKILHGSADNLIKKIFTPWWVLWYLLSLICWRFALQFIPDKILRHTKIVIISTCFISILAGFLPFDRFLSLQRTFAFMPFFFMGYYMRYYMRYKNLYLPDKYKPLCIVFLIVMFAIPIFFSQYLELTHTTPYSNAYAAAKRIFVFALAIPMSIAFINSCYNMPTIARQGILTMQYYIYHALIIPPLIVFVGKLNIPMNFTTATIITIGIVLGISFVLKIPYVKMLTNPSSLFKNNIK